MPLIYNLIACEQRKLAHATTVIRIALGLKIMQQLTKTEPIK
jgi:hypothetical protein